MTTDTPTLLAQDEAAHQLQVINSTGYAYHQSNMGDMEGQPNNRKRYKLEVTFILDMVPGLYHQPIDLMRAIAQHSYVDTVTLVENKP